MNAVPFTVSVVDAPCGLSTLLFGSRYQLQITRT